jgi:TrmH family RNA methyltransferase
VGRPGDIVVLDGVRIVGNIGAIIRTATGLGAAGVVLIDSGLTTVADRRLLRASRGYVFSLPVVLSTAERLREFLDEHFVDIAVLEADGQVELSQVAAGPEPLALVFGSERAGTSELLRSVFSDHEGDWDRSKETRTVSIPMPGPVESFNVSVAAAIVLYSRSLHAISN